MPGVSLNQKLATFTDLWAPQVIARFNGRDIMVVKVKGAFAWHAHADADDFFLMLQGRLVIQLRGENVQLDEGERYGVPRRAEHRPPAPEEAHLPRIEPYGEPNTGDPRTAAPKDIL